MSGFWRATKLILTLHCDESERLISQSLDQRLPWAERWAVRMHFVSCRSCRRVKKQLQFIHQAGQRRAELSGSADVTLSADARERIARALEREN